MSNRGSSIDTDNSTDSESDLNSQPERQRSRSRSPLRKINNSIANSNISNMALPVVPQLKQEYLNMIPEFHGETTLLSRFLEISEKLVSKFYNANDVTDFQNEYLMSSILAKIKGDAAVSISSCLINNWNDLKTALLNAYSDKRDIYTLTIEMSECKQRNESPFDFFNKIQHLLYLQVLYILTHSPNVVKRETLIRFNRNLALRAFLKGLKEPLGSLMRTKNPEDLTSALSMLTNDFQFEINQYRTTQHLVKKSQKIEPFFIKTQPTPQTQLTDYSHNNRFTPKIQTFSSTK